MTDRNEWLESRDELVRTIKELGFPEELGIEIFKKQVKLQIFSGH